MEKQPVFFQDVVKSFSSLEGNPIFFLDPKQFFKILGFIL